MNKAEKIKQINNWLIHNPQHPDYATMLKDKQHLETQDLNEYDN